MTRYICINKTKIPQLEREAFHINDLLDTTIEALEVKPTSKVLANRRDKLRHDLRWKYKELDAYVKEQEKTHTIVSFDYFSKLVAADQIDIYGNELK